ncbi:Leucine Rich Repeat family protein [Ditylenchus destructor]|uniref:Leucine Rich Repeat family protein n=1 Tax=Ditylenchus destructor TaxID=166010 RepID=A0AAD4QYC3_9BILA|nr:Leucine Rich Repeat family protein [Ditylenchus destructor]
MQFTYLFLYVAFSIIGLNFGANDDVTDEEDDDSLWRKTTLICEEDFYCNCLYGGVREGKFEPSTVNCTSASWRGSSLNTADVIIRFEMFPGFVPEEVRMDHNKIRVLRPVVDFSGSRLLEKIDDNAFGSFIINETTAWRMEMLNLRDCNFTRISKDLLDWRSKKLALAGNPLHCSCETMKWLSMEENVHLVGPEAVCQYPEAFRNVPLLRLTRECERMESASSNVTFASVTSASVTFVVSTLLVTSMLLLLLFFRRRILQLKYFT